MQCAVPSDHNIYLDANGFHTITSLFSVHYMHRSREPVHGFFLHHHCNFTVWDDKDNLIWFDLIWWYCRYGVPKTNKQSNNPSGQVRLHITKVCGGDSRSDTITKHFTNTPTELSQHNLHFDNFSDTITRGSGHSFVVIWNTLMSTSQQGLFSFRSTVFCQRHRVRIKHGLRDTRVPTSFACRYPIPVW